ncbi:MAG: hypothetical protein ACLFUU_07135 [Desulfobacteraceae bacterium]
MSDITPNAAVQVKAISGLFEKKPLLLVGITIVLTIACYYLKSPGIFAISVVIIILAYHRYRQQKDNTKYNFAESLVINSVFVIFLSSIDIFVVIILRIIGKFTT